MSSSSGGYDPKAVESEIYALWEAGGYFHAEPDPEHQPFVIVIPPPNVTGALHLGHALNNTLQDILIRRKRMQGFNACWLPGTDHAGIATQAVVEKRLRQEQGWKRDSSNPEHREFLVGKIREWKDEYEARILNQLKKMGCSCDWERTRFTLDEQCAKAVYETFFRFFKDGLIYRGLRLVNWDCELQTAVADDEVYHETVRGHLWHIRYPIEGSGFGVQGSGATGGVQSSALPSDAKLGTHYLVVATTRPETMLADTAVAVHPEDERYRHLIGKRVILPLMNRPIPIIADGMLVKREFGTGCVKVTPGHDPNDHACYQRKLGQPDEIGIIDLLTPDGRINENGRAARRGEQPPSAAAALAAGERSTTETQPGAAALHDYSGMKKEDARKKVVADLEALGLLEKVEPYETEVGHSDRSKTPIEPLRSEQWFVAMDKAGAPRLAETAMEAVRDGRVRFFPERYAKTYLDWLGEKRDWCISRQLWWGHRIPVWTKNGLSEHEADDACEDLAATLLGEVRTKSEFKEWSSASGRPAKAHWQKIPQGDGKFAVRVCMIDADPVQLKILEAAAPDAGYGFQQDPDVLDTWFSSALWPHSTFGWPGAGESKAPALAGSERKAGALHSPSVDYFYPTSVLSTAREIITLWVARMVMTGLYNMGRVPFSHVYIHAVIQDGHGRRMSKSAGNGVDPLDIIDAYGADALRFTLAQMATETQDIRIPVKPAQLPDGRTVNTSERFELGRNLVNKLWQAATGFVIPTCRDVRIDLRPSGECKAPALRADGKAPASRADGKAPASHSTGNAPALHATSKAELCTPRHTSRRPGEMPLFEKWIRVKLLACIRDVDRRLENYEFSAAVDAIRTFFWNDLCDWYIEEVKSHLREAGADEDEKNDVKITLLQVFDIALCLFHPAIPFVTEALWRRIGEEIPRHHELIWPEASATEGGRDAGAASNPNPPREWAAGRATGVKPPTGVGGSDAAPPLIVMPWPRADGDAWLAEVDAQKDAEREVDSFLIAIRALREIRTTINAIRSQSKQPALRNLPSAVVRCDAATAERLRNGSATIKRLGQAEQLTIGSDAARPPQSLSRILTGMEVYVPIAGLADIEIERKRLAKERDETAAAIQRLEGKLANEGFVAKAKPEVVEAERARLAELKDKLATIERNAAQLA